MSDMGMLLQRSGVLCELLSVMESFAQGLHD